MASLWSSQIFGWDTLTVLAVVGREVPDIDLGTAVIPVHPRHPMMLAEQALTVQSASGGRLTLGIGLSHQVVVEGAWGYSFDKPARYIREYLSVLMPLLAQEQVAFSGEVITTNTFGPLDVAPPRPPRRWSWPRSAPPMLRMAGTMADGTITWMVGPSTVAGHVAPTITAAAAEAGRPAPRVVVTLPVCVGTDPDAARARADRIFALYGQLPSYRAMLDREGAAGPADVAIVGDEDAVAAQVQRIVEAGATEILGRRVRRTRRGGPDPGAHGGVGGGGSLTTVARQQHGAVGQWMAAVARLTRSPRRRWLVLAEGDSSRPSEVNSTS